MWHKWTHKNQNAFSIVLPTFGHLRVFIICSPVVPGEEQTGAVSEDGFIR